MLDFQIQQTPFRFGIEEGIDPKQVPVGTLLTAENVVWKKSGRLEKRNGTSAPYTRAIHEGGSLTSAQRLFARGSELCLIDGTNLYSYNAPTTQWYTQGKVTECGLTWKTSLDAFSGASSIDTAATSNFLLQAWVSGDPSSLVGVAGGATAFTTGRLYYQIINRVTGAVVEGPSSHNDTITTFWGCRWVVIGTNAFLVSRNGANIVVLKFDLTTSGSGGMFVSATNVRADANSRGFDAATIGDNLLIIAYENNANALKLYSYNAALVQQATGGVTGEAGTTFNNISIDGLTGREIYVVYSVDSSSKVRAALCDPSTLAQAHVPVDIVTATTPNHVGVRRVDTNQAIILYDELFLDYKAIAKSIQVSNSLVVSATITRGLYGGMWASRPFVQGGIVYAFLTGPHSTSALSTTGASFEGLYTALVECELTANRTPEQPPRDCGRTEVLLGAYTTRGHLPAVVSVSATEFVVGLPFLADPRATSGLNLAGVNQKGLRSGIRLVTITQGTSRPKDMWRVALDKEAYFSGGYLHAYDGRTVFDYGFASAPMLRLQSAGGGGSVAAGDYFYACHHEYRSNAGIRHRSPTASTTKKLTSGAAGTNTIDMTGSDLSSFTKLKWQTGAAAIGLTTVPASVLNVFFRTEVGKSTLYRLTVEPRYNTLVNDPTVIGQSFVDANADADIGGTIALNTRPGIYTSGDTLQDYQPPASTTLVRHRDRLFIIDGSEREVWFSKSFQDDLGTTPGFHPDFRFVFDRRLVALASMDESLFIFAEDAVWILKGEGPSANESNNDFGAPIKLQTDAGCTNPRSIVTDADGIFFQCGTDLYKLSRGLETMWLGKQAKDTLSSFPTITSGVFLPNDKQVRFSCNAADGLSGVVLVYSTAEKQWSTFRYYDTNTSTASVPIADACLFGNLYTFVTTTGTVFQEDQTTSLDAGTHWTALLLETAWWHAAGPLGFQVVRNFRMDGISQSDHQLLMYAGFNGETTYRQGPRVWFEGILGVTKVGAIEHANLSVGTRRTCRSIRFKVTDAAPSAGSLGTGRGPIFDTMGIEVGVKKGLGKIPARAQR